MNLNFFRRIYVLLTNKNNKKIRVQLLKEFLRITAKWVILSKLLRRDITSESVMGYKVNFFDYASFYPLVEEIFCEYVYYFKTNKKAPVIIDCGAGIGMAALFFKMLYPNSKITCFEPNPGTYKLLEANIRQNGLKNVTLVNAAVSSNRGKLSLFRSKLRRAGGADSTVFNDAGPEIEKVEVSSEKLSEHIGASVDCLKLDIEGAEREVLEEIEHKFKNIRKIAFEYHYYPNLRTNNLSEILRLLEVNDYYIFLAAENNRPQLYKYNAIWYNYVYAEKKNGG